jgi:DNA polymerase
MPTLYRDYETRSTHDLREVGAWRYTISNTTDVWCAAYALDDGPIKLWVPGDPVPEEFIAAAQDPTWIVVAFNDQFERLVERHILAPRYGWPEIPIERHRCLQAAALALALPAKLEKVAEALHLEHRKDKTGAKHMLRMAKPRKPRPGEDAKSIYWADTPEDRERLGEYCKGDLAAERALERRIGYLSPELQAQWVLDATKINDRGIYLDGQLLNAAISIAETAEREITTELLSITGGEVSSINQTGKLMTWLAAHDCIVKDVTRTSLKHALRRTQLPPEARRVIELRLDGAHASAAKLKTMRNWRNPADGRVRGAFRFHGAGTGRWTSFGIQVQNLKRPEVADLDAAIEAVATGDYAHLKARYSQPMSVVGDVTRALICAPPGHRLIAGDFSGIESRVTAYLSGQQSKLDQWAKFDRTQSPEDEPYYIFGRRQGLSRDRARDTGKVADLAFGFMGGLGAWKKLAGSDDTSTDEEIRARQRAWRNAHPHTVRFWHGLNTAAIRAIQNPGELITCQRIGFDYDREFLRMRLLNGRKIAYPFARLTTTSNHVVTFMDNAAGKWAECRYGQGAYGGTWCENAVQGVARDLLAEAVRRLETSGYPVTLHVHDEIVAEVPDGSGSLEEFQRILTTPPAWAEGLPIAAKVREGPRFCKITESEAKPEAAPSEEGSNPELTQQSSTMHDGAAQSSPEGDSYSSGERPWGNNIAEYVYQAADGMRYLKVVRTSAKQFPQFHWEAGRWQPGKPTGPKIPYRLPELLAAPLNAWVLVCAGEKDAESAAELGFVSTTNSGGEGKGQWTPELNIWFAGRKRVAIMEDNDDTGRAHAIEVANALRGLVPDIRIVTFRELAERGDLTDWIEAGHRKDELIARIEGASRAWPVPQPAPIRQWAGKPVPHPEYTVPDRFPAEQVCLLSGEGGEGKSTLAQHLCAAHALARDWLGCQPRPGPAIYLECEDAERVLHWRLAALADHYGVPIEAFADAGLQLFSLIEHDTILAATNRNGIVEPTGFYRWLYELAGDVKPVMIGIASSANVFAGNENVRPEVQQFVKLLARIAIVTGGSVLLITHPSVTGM